MRILRIPRLYADESFPGFMARTADVNGYDKPSWIYEMVGLKNLYRFGERMIFKANHLTLLSSLTGISKDIFIGLTSSPMRNSKAVMRPQMFGQEIEEGMIMPSSIKVCPACLIENLYIRRIWSLRALTSCPTHGNLLIDKCPRCGSDIILNKIKTNECRCGYDYRKAKQFKIANEQLALDKLIHVKCGLQRIKSNDHQSIGIESILTSWSLSEVISSVNFFASQHYRVCDATGIKFYSKNDIKSLNKLLSRTVNMFSQWPLAFYHYLDDIKKLRRKLSNRRRLGDDFGSFSAYLNDSFNQDKFAFIRSAFEDYILNNITEYKNMKRGISEEVISKSDYITVSKARATLRITSKKMRDLIEKKVFNGTKRASKEVLNSVLRKDTVEEYRRALETSVSKASIQRMLGVTQTTVDDFVTRGYLRKSSIVTEIKPLKGSIEKDTIDQLLTKIDKQLIKPNKSGELIDKVSLQIATKMLTFARINFIELIAKIVAGEINPCRKKIKSGLITYYLQKKDVIALRERTILTQCPNTVSVQEAARLLGLQFTVVMHLCRAKIIKHRTILAKKRKMLRIKKKEIESFKEKYVRITNLAAQLKIGLRYLRHDLTKKKIFPLPLRRGCIYKIADLHAAGFENIS